MYAHVKKLIRLDPQTGAICSSLSSSLSHEGRLGQQEADGGAAALEGAHQRAVILQMLFFFP